MHILFSNVPQIKPPKQTFLSFPQKKMMKSFSVNT